MIIMNIENLVVGTTYKNWGVLCEVLGVESKTGNSKPAQKKEFARYFSWEKQGQKITITEIYEEPKEKIDGRKINGKSGKSFEALMKHRYTQPKATMNEYKICGDYVELYMENSGQKYTCIFDTEDLDKVLQERKYRVTTNHVISIDGVWIHRLIMGLPRLDRRIQLDDLVVHHINENPLDNRKSNLMVLTQLEHMELHGRLITDEKRKELEKIASNIKEILLNNGFNIECIDVKKAMKMLAV